MNENTILAKVKANLCITGSYQDTTIQGWIDEVKGFLVEGGVAEENITELSTSYHLEYDKNGNIKTDKFGNITGYVGQFKHMVEEVVDGVKTLVEKVGTMIDVFFKTISG